MRKFKKKVKERGVDGALIFTILSVIIFCLSKLICLLMKHFIKTDKNNIVFESIPDYSDNAYALFQYMLSNYPKAHFYWLVENPDAYAAINKKNITFLSSKSQYYKGLPLKSVISVQLSKFIFFTHGSPVAGMKKRKDQVIINLWHGCGYKAVEKHSKKQKINFDFALVPGSLFIQPKMKFWECKKEQILAIGYPRYDFLLTPNDRAAEFINTLRKSNKKLIFWMPTFRKTIFSTYTYPEENIKRPFELPLLNSTNDMKELNNKCRQTDTILVIKRHPFQIKYESEKLDLSNIKFIDDNDLKKNSIQLYQVLQYTDALISDYSSIAVDYLLLNKPIAFALDDFQEYKNSRGFVFSDPLKYMPGDHLYSSIMLFKFIQDIANGLDKNKSKRDGVMKEMHNVTTDYRGDLLKKIGFSK